MRPNRARTTHYVEQCFCWFNFFAWYGVKSPRSIFTVIPAQAGIYDSTSLDSGLRRNDGIGKTTEIKNAA